MGDKMTKPNSLDLIPLIDDEQKFREAMVLLPVWEQVRPKPWKHIQSDYCADGGGFYCLKCKVDWNKILVPCPIPDAFTGSLAELTFELRDKIKLLDFEDGLRAVYYNVHHVLDWDCWIYKEAKPEHWICAALLALEITKNDIDNSGK
jgi:hypothetical protein